MSASAPDTSPAKPRGRRRDPGIAPRAFAAALEVYATTGWSGLTFEAVARQSGVGKPAIYRRWDGPESLLISALESIEFPIARDLGSLRADVQDYAEQWARWFRTSHLPELGHRLLVDTKTHEELHRQYHGRVMGPRVIAVRAVTARALERGEIPAGTPTTMLPELLLGAFFIHWAFAENPDSSEFRDGLPGFASSTADAVLRGLRASG